MLKSVFGVMIFNLVLFFGFFQDEGVSVVQNCPNSLAPGESFEVTVNILKPNISGFAKLELNVEDGLEVKVGDVGSASFTFDKGVAKFIWFALPGDAAFQIKYVLKNNDEDIGKTKKISGHFSYLVDNQKKVFYLKDAYIDIRSIENDTLVAIDEIIVPDMTNEMSMMTEKELIESIQNHVVMIDRKFERLKSGEYQMSISIDKGPIEGFAKLEDIVPDGFDYVENKNAGAIFTNIKGKAKFVWFNLPEEEIVKVSYKLKANESNVVGIHNITGTFTYLIDSKDIKSSTIPAFFKISPDDLVEIIQNDDFRFDGEKVDSNLVREFWTQENVNFLENTEESSKSVESTLENENQDQSSDQNSIVSDNSTKSDSELIQDITGIESNSEGVTYRVQICAVKKIAEKDYFRKYKNFNYDIIIDHHENWIKYTTGNYPIYKTARASRVLINDKYDFDGPFVTAYNGGDRITVQEALMISNQKWYK